MDDYLRRILELNSSLQQVFFKEFIKQYDLPDGVNDTHIRALMTIRFFKEIAMSDVSHRLCLEKGSFTPVANKLIKLGLVKKRQDENDRRVYKLSLTPSGVTLTEDYGQTHAQYINELIDRLSDDRKCAFLDAINVVSDTIISLSLAPEEIHMRRK